MKIKSFTCIVGDDERLLTEHSFHKSICFLRGRDSEMILDLMRETIGNSLPHSNLNSYHHGHFVLHSDVEIDNKDYRVCYIRSAVDEETRIAVNFRENSLRYSLDDTTEYLKKCAALNKTSSNVLIGTATVKDLQDQRPIFIYNYFDRLDEAVDITPMLDGLASLGRQVFISVCPNYPEVNHEKVQMVQI